MALYWILAFVVFGLANSIVAQFKGYNGFIWFFSAGLVSLIILAFLPNTYKPGLPNEERKELLIRGNRLGAWLIVLTAVLVFVRFVPYLAWKGYI
jgi:hypothetical protein